MEQAEITKQNRTRPKQNIKGKPTEDALLMEYHLCQQHANTSSRRSWQSAGILLAGAIAGLTLLMSAYISGQLALKGISPDNRILVNIAVTALVVIMISVLQLLRRIVRREVFFQNVCYRRMREIEARLGLLRAIYCGILADWPNRKRHPYWKALTEEQKKDLKVNYSEGGLGAPRPQTSIATYRTIKIIQIGWLFCLFSWVYPLSLNWPTVLVGVVIVVTAILIIRQSDV
jgi:hypothetical protein